MTECHTFLGVTGIPEPCDLNPHATLDRFYIKYLN